MPSLLLKLHALRLAQRDLARERVVHVRELLLARAVDVRDVQISLGASNVPTVYAIFVKSRCRSSRPLDATLALRDLLDDARRATRGTDASSPPMPPVK